MKRLLALFVVLCVIIGMTGIAWAAIDHIYVQSGTVTRVHCGGKAVVGTVTNSNVDVWCTNGDGEIRFANGYTTAYDWWDNNPPQSYEICCPSIHSSAGGVGTYADPLTVAVDYSSGTTMQFSVGTKFYIPNVRAYFVVEDRTGEQQATNTLNHNGTNPHLDMWADGHTSTFSNSQSCLSSITDEGVLIIQNPLSNYVVVSGSLAANNGCRSTFGNNVLTN